MLFIFFNASFCIHTSKIIICILWISSVAYFRHGCSWYHLSWWKHYMHGVVEMGVYEIWLASSYIICTLSHVMTFYWWTVDEAWYATAAYHIEKFRQINLYQVSLQWQKNVFLCDINADDITDYQYSAVYMNIHNVCSVKWYHLQEDIYCIYSNTNEKATEWPSSSER